MVRIAPCIGAALVAAGAAAGVDGAPGPVLEVRDWVAACDNLLGCAALGLGPEDGPGAYVAVRRDAGPDAGPVIRLSARAGAAEARQLATRVEGPGGRLLAESYPAEAEGGRLVATVAGEEATALVEALRDGLDLELVPEGAAPQQVSLRGSTAAFRHIDARQGREGTETALVEPGAAPASAVPAPPAAAPVPRLPIKALTEPLPPLPAAVPAPADPSCAAVRPLALALTDGSTLWGVCERAAAYNTEYRFWIERGDDADPVAFADPGAEADPGVLVNPGLAPDRHAIEATAFGRGLGDCGIRSRWAWTGSAFALVELRAMPACRGVPPDDWPVLLAAPG